MQLGPGNTLHLKEMSVPLYHEAKICSSLMPELTFSSQECMEVFGHVLRSAPSAVGRPDVQIEKRLKINK